MSQKNKSEKSSQYKTLLSVLANGSTDSARILLKKHSGQDAKSIQDLEEKLAKLYIASDDKLELEKEFASIHPHKDFILKYTKPVEEKPLKREHERIPVELQEEGIKTSHDGFQKKSNAEGHAPCGNPNCKKCHRYLNCEGNESCPSEQLKSNAEGQ
jgi:hypothetical protein